MRLCMDLVASNLFIKSLFCLLTPSNVYIDKLAKYVDLYTHEMIQLFAFLVQCLNYLRNPSSDLDSGLFPLTI